MNIIGAGLSGLIAAHAFPRCSIYERSPAPEQMHKAVLRFRNDSVSHLTGIPFRKVTVRKGVWSGGQYVQPSIALANYYSRKVIGRIHNDRSIWKLDPVERYIAPEDFYEQLLNNVGGRVYWDYEFELDATQEKPLISTMPLPAAIKQLGLPCDLSFEYEPIKVQRWRIHDCDAFQTVYFPTSETNVYRASITGDLLIVESMDYGGEVEDQDALRNMLVDAFGISSMDMEALDNTTQRFGKIAAVDDAERKRLLYRLTANHNIYSLGRFATWRNMLLDDLVNDITVIKQLMKGSDYEHRMAAR